MRQCSDDFQEKDLFERNADGTHVTGLVQSICTSVADNEKYTCLKSAHGGGTTNPSVVNTTEGDLHCSVSLGCQSFPPPLFRVIDCIFLSYTKAASS